MPKTTFADLKGVLASNILLARLSQGISQEDLALKSAVDRSYVSRLELAVANPSMLILYRLAESLGVEVAELFGGY